jgi:ATP-binding protein involved in chromosome partitioning
LQQALAAIVIPDTQLTVGDVGRVLVDDDSGSATAIRIELGVPVAGIRQQIEAAADDIVSQAGAGTPTVSVGSQVREHGVQRSLKPLGNVKNIIAIASGKGGVGSRRPLRTWRLRWQPTAPPWACWTPTFTVPASH